MKKHSIFYALLFLTSLSFGQTSTLNRPNDPVVLTGAQLTTFSGLLPSQIVGFKFVNGIWTQIPVQVDERALTDIVIPYGPYGSSLNLNPSPSNLRVLYYCDPSTYTGSDPAPLFDNDDELVFMVKDAGGQSNGTIPQGVVASTCREVTITDPLGGSGTVYLFQNGGSLQQGAGISYINYSTNLPSTIGFPAHGNGYNTENTNVSTSKYSWRFSAEWVCDEYKLIAGNNTDILDRYKNFFANGNCLRHEDAFSAAENAFVTARSGPIRAIRSVLGAVSGPLTQRTHIFYEGRQDISTDLRVHNIASIYDVFDYNSNANGMTYRNNLNTSGVTINGQQDVITSGDIVWEQISGAPGTISILHRRTTTFVAPTEASFTSYYDDNSSSPASNCTGDGQAWGSSGIGVVFYDPNQCTDPRHPCGTNPSLYRTLQSRRTVYSDQSNGAASTASNYNNQFNNPLVITISTCSGTSTNFTVSTSSNPAAGGTTTGSGTYANGTNVTVTATANSGYGFSNWTENGSVVSSSASYSFTISANRTLVANFSQSTTNYTVTTSSSPTAGGTTTGGGTYANGTNVAVTATANSGYSFSRWTENGTQVSTSTSYSFTIGSNRNLVANFNQNQQYNCGVPTNLTATNITGTTAVIGWSFATAPSFRIRYRVVGSSKYTYKTFSPASGVFTYQLTGLKRNTSYEVSLQSVCSTSSSAFSTAITFRTTAATIRMGSDASGVSQDPTGFKAFPNPSSGTITIETSFEGELLIVNSAGQEIKKMALNASRNEVEIQENGIYLLLVRDQAGNVFTERVVIQK